MVVTDKNSVERITTTGSARKRHIAEISSSDSNNSNTTTTERKGERENRPEVQVRGSQRKEIPKKPSVITPKSPAPTTFTKTDTNKRVFNSPRIVKAMLLRALQEWEKEIDTTSTRASNTVHWSYLAPPLQGKQGIDVRVATQEYSNGKVKVTLAPDHILNILAMHITSISDATSNESKVLSLEPISWTNSKELGMIRDKNQWKSVHLKEQSPSICWTCHASTEAAKLKVLPKGETLTDLENLTNIPVNEPNVCEECCRSESVWDTMLQTISDSE